jgi:hypothetical protein
LSEPNEATASAVSLRALRERFPSGFARRTADDESDVAQPKVRLAPELKASRTVSVTAGSRRQFEAACVKMERYGFAVARVQYGNAAALRLDRRTVGHIAERIVGPAYVSVEGWPGVRLEGRSDITGVLDDEVRLVAALRLAATHYDSDPVTLHVAYGATAALCPVCGRSAEMPRQAGGATPHWRCSRWPVCVGIGELIVGPRVRVVMPSSEGSLVRINDVPAIYLHLLPDSHHRLRTDPQLLADGSGICPECGAAVASQFTSRQDER